VPETGKDGLERVELRWKTRGDAPKPRRDVTHTHISAQPHTPAVQSPVSTPNHVLDLVPCAAFYASLA